MANLSKKNVLRRSEGLKGWGYRGEGIAKTYTFKTFLDAIIFINRIAIEAEAINHHPDITLNYNKITFNIISHNKNAITDRDFALARRIDSTFSKL